MYRLNDEQQRIADNAAAVADRDLAPRAAAVDREADRGEQRDDREAHDRHHGAPLVPEQAAQDPTSEELLLAAHRRSLRTAPEPWEACPALQIAINHRTMSQAWPNEHLIFMMFSS